MQTKLVSSHQVVIFLEEFCTHWSVIGLALKQAKQKMLGDEVSCQTYRLRAVSCWSQDCSAVRLLPDRSRPPLPVYVNTSPSSWGKHQENHHTGIVPSRAAVAVWTLVLSASSTKCIKSREETCNNVVRYVRRLTWCWIPSQTCLLDENMLYCWTQRIALVRRHLQLM